MKRFARLLFVLAPLAVSLVFLLDPGAQAAPDATITVNTTADTNSRDGVLTLREAMLLATGGLAVDALDGGECGQVSSSTYGPPCSTSDTIGAASADTIVFDPTLFQPGSPPTINLGSTLPTLGTGNDSVDASSAGVIVWKTWEAWVEPPCFDITSSGNVIKGLEIGGCYDGAILIHSGAQNNTIGGATPAERNVISCRIDDGVRIFDTGTNGNVVKGNYIGTDSTGNNPFPCTNGVVIANGSQNNTIGGTGAGERNIISAVSGYYGSGVDIRDSNTTGNVVKGNYIGTNAAGAVPLGNHNGVVIRAGARSNVVEQNLISGNDSSGVALTDSLTNANVVKGNYIGTDASGTAPLPNNVGVYIANSAQNNTVGGSTTAERNVISGNTTGVRIEGSSTSGNVVRGNYIGTDAAGAAALPNDYGVNVAGDNSDIGGRAAGEGNLIAYNRNDGVVKSGTANTISGNSIHSNGGKGISTASPAPPIIDGVGSASGHTSPPCYSCTVEVFSDDADEGRIFDGYTTTSIVDGTWAYPGPVSGPYITATLTDVSGNTSEFSAPVAFSEPTPTPTPTVTPTPTATPVPPEDADGDGLPDYRDGCPLLGEDFDGFQDADGCPEADNDMDGVCDPWATPSLPACTGSDACPNVAEDYDAYRDTDGCPDPDNDGDGFPDGTDECPATDWTAGPDGIADSGDEPLNEHGVPIQTKEDYDGIIDTDGCHDSPGDDYDGDSLGMLNQRGFPIFWDEAEVYLGTDPQDACPDNSSDDAWPPDINMDTWANILDVLLFKPVIMTSVPPSPARFDLNVDGNINILDVLLYKPAIMTQCTNP